MVDGRLLVEVPDPETGEVHSHPAISSLPFLYYLLRNSSPYLLYVTQCSRLEAYTDQGLSTSFSYLCRPGHNHAATLYMTNRGKELKRMLETIGKDSPLRLDCEAIK